MEHLIFYDYPEWVDKVTYSTEVAYSIKCWTNSNETLTNLSTLKHSPSS